MSCLRALERGPRVVAIRHRLAHRRDLLVGRRLLVLRAVDAELRFDLPQRALRPLERERQLARLEAHQHVADAHVAAELNRDLADDAGDLAADARLIGRDEGAGEVDPPLDANALGGRGLDVDGLSAAPSAAATAAAACRIGLPRRGIACRCGRANTHERERHECE